MSRFCSLSIYIYIFEIEDVIWVCVRFLDDLTNLMPKWEQKKILSEARPGTLLQMLSSVLHSDPVSQYDIYEKFIPRTKGQHLAFRKKCSVNTI